MATVVMPPLKWPRGDFNALQPLQGRFWYNMRERRRTVGGYVVDFTAEEKTMIEFFVRKTVGRPLPLADLYAVVNTIPAAEFARTLEGATLADVERVWAEATVPQKEAALKGWWEELANATDPIPARTRATAATPAAARDIRTFTPTETDRMGAPVVLTRDITDKGTTYPAGTEATVFWFGLDKYNAARMRVGIRIGDEKVYVAAGALQRNVKYVTAPFKVGDRVRVNGAPDYYGGTVVYMRQQRDTAHVRRVGGIKGRRYGTPKVDGWIGDWLLKIDWDAKTVERCAERGKTPPTWLYAAQWDVVKVAE